MFFAKSKQNVSIILMKNLPSIHRGPTWHRFWIYARSLHTVEPRKIKFEAALTSGFSIQHPDVVKSTVVSIFHVDGVEEQEDSLALAHLDQGPAIRAVRIVTRKSRTAKRTGFLSQQILAIWKKSRLLMFGELMNPFSTIRQVFLFLLWILH